MRAYVDSDILIAHLRGERKALALFRRLAKRKGIELWIGAMQRVEVVFFMRAHEEDRTLAFLSRFRTQPLTQDVVDRGGVLYRRWHRSHGTDVNDALLAAMAAATAGQIYTLNLKHYAMPEVVVRKGW